MSINSLSSSSTVLTIYLCTQINILNSLLLHFATLVNTYLTKSLSHINPNLTILGKTCILNNIFHYAGNFLRIMLALCSMLLPPYYAQNYAGIIGSSLVVSHTAKQSRIYERAIIKSVTTVRIYTHNNRACIHPYQTTRLPH